VRDASASNRGLQLLSMIPCLRLYQVESVCFLCQPLSLFTVAFVEKTIEKVFIPKGSPWSYTCKMLSYVSKGHTLEAPLLCHFSSGKMETDYDQIFEFV
jgi:hypothetical protein